jgi:hypothetical protein
MTERRYLETSELSSAQHLEVLHARRVGGRIPRFERAEYRAQKIEALSAAGLEDEAEEIAEAAAVPKSVGGHLAHIRRQPGAQARAGRSPRAA